METEFDALSVEPDEESAGALIRRSSKVKSGINLKENGRILKENDETKTLKMEAEVGEVSSLISNVEVAENTAENGKENCRPRGEVRTGKLKEMEPSERTLFEESVCREKEELLGGEVSNGHFLSTISSNCTAVTTMPTNSTEADMKQPKALSEWSESFVKEEGSEGRAILDKEGEVIDCENKDTELVKDEVIQTMTEVTVNQTSVSEIIMQNSQDGFVSAQDETQLSDHWSRTLENSASKGKVEEIVRVLKEQQSHDLLCPVCGSCITKRVILRKRKRVSTVSVDRWIKEPDDHTQAALLEGGQQTTGDESDQPEISHEYSDGTDAYGCLACFSIFFRRVVDVQHLLTKSESVKKSLADQDPSSVLQDTRDIPDKDKESFYCLPFRNPWQKTSKKEPKPAAAEEPRRSSSNDMKDSHSIATQSKSYQSSIAEKETEPFLTSTENIGSKISKYTLTEVTNITRSDKSSHLKEQFTPAERSEDQLAEIHLDDSARLHAKHEDQEKQAKTETSDGDASIILPDMLPSNVKTSIQENVGSKKIKYTVTEATHITQYLNQSDKSSQSKDQFPPAKSEDELAVLHFYDAGLHAKREEQEHANTKYPHGGVSKILPDVLPSNIEKNIPEEESATYDRESDDFSTVQRDEEFQKDTASPKDISYKTDYTFNCIPISIQRVWSIWSLKESITDQQLKDPLLAKEKLEENVSMLPDASVSHDILQSNKVLIRSQPPDDKESEATSPLLSARVKSSGLLIKGDPALLHSEEPAISTDVTVSPVQTVIEVESAIDDSQPSVVATTVPELTGTPTPQPQATQIVDEWDIVKSIVYGGLVVSLTSLGVVSSTAGGEAKTLTVISIGLSNLVAGLFVILNNMLDLDHYHKDQFIERVGHSSWFNGFLAIISYIIFGSLAPITYAFSFRKSNDRMYKFITTSAASLVCIILLALGKARISKKSYIRTVTLYIVTGFWSAVVGFFAGEYIKKLLEKWGL